MKILRSQYMKLRNNAGGPRSDPNNGIGKKISHKEQITDNGNKQLSNIGSKNALPIGALRRASVNLVNSFSEPPATNIKILFDNVDESLKKLNVVVEFTTMDAMWLTRVYRTYENELWHRKPRLDVFGKKKWFFQCHLCDRVLMAFIGLKTHLNRHLNYYPYVCKLCLKKYTNRKAVTSHLKKIHNISKEDWNDNLTS
ncbi:hypothetical protein FF38_12347 [Lucilia cuprina]|uniref:C2H2-type domain-containing protein n=1 Tax=Lucilia cuprina TaxID=7375 RepID=A0A0L0C5I1_LUCCU|nr:Zinc finger protein ZFAT [Lucilia cuprina]KNC27540.1 hypothetical protein FF38_12347 [Lucilia cuprina]